MFPRKNRLAMTILVRDEVDIIGENIRFHATQGVDHFTVMDNGSVDGTRELLSALSDEFDIDIIDNPQHTIDQDLWVTQMAQQVCKSGRADWVIHNDADEFWVNSNGNLKREIRPDIGVVSVSRQNMLPLLSDVSEPDYRFYDNVMRVAKSPGSDRNVVNPDESLDIEMNLRKLPGKVMCRLNGLHHVQMGNHSVSHDGEVTRSDNTLIYHFPVRTFEQFVKKVSNYGSALEANKRFSLGTSWHLRRWYKLLKLGQLEQEYESMLLTAEQASKLQSEGVLVRDETILSFHQDSN